MAIANLLLVGITRAGFAGRLKQHGYNPIDVPDIASIGSVEEHCDLMLIDAGLIEPQRAEQIERLYFLNNNTPIAVCVGGPTRPGARLPAALAEGTFDVLYYSEARSGLIVKRIDRMVISARLNKSLSAVQQHLQERENLERELSLRNHIVDHERDLNANIIASIGSGIIILDMSGITILINDHARKLLGLADGLIGARYNAVLPQAVCTVLEKLRDRPESAQRIEKVNLNDVFVQIAGYQMRDSGGKPIGMLLFIQDVTEQEQTAVHLYRAEKLATIGTMLSGISHELRNPLSIISARAQRARSRDKPDPELIAKTLDSIEKQAERCSTIINNLLDFTRHTSTALGYHAIGDILEETLTYVEYQNLFDNITVEKNHGDRLDVFGDRSRLVQVFLNLITNAADAMEGRGRLRLSARLFGAGFVVVEINDTGPGIDAKIQKRIFDPFFTTKGPGKGTGLGLAIAHKIVQESGGEIRFTSQPGDTSFFVRLPSSKDHHA